MLLRIDTASAEPLHAQIAAQLRRALAEGQLVPGEQLPTARDLASSLEVNMHTVLRAYASLRDEGLIEMRRGRGVTVLARGDRAHLIDLARQLLSEARRVGVGPRELGRLMKELA